MKAVILAGGLGTRLSELTESVPKPLVPIGDKPILWHIMNYYARWGVEEFIICAGYKVDKIIEYVSNLRFSSVDATFDLANGSWKSHAQDRWSWRVTVVDTGLNTMTGGRLARVAHHLSPGEEFFFTYGDGLSDVNLQELLAFHRNHSGLVTVTGVAPHGRFGTLMCDDASLVTDFSEKPLSTGLINGGFFVANYDAISRVFADDESWEHEPMQRLVAENQIYVWRHEGFWHPMDTLRDNKALNALWASGKAPWALDE